MAPPVVSFGGTTIGAPLTQQVVLTNTGAAPLTLQGISVPAAPFSAPQLPPVGTQLPASSSVTFPVVFSPTALGTFSGTLSVQSSAGPKSILLTGVGGLPGHLSITPLNVDFGRVALGAKHWSTFTVANTGGVAITITKSKPPVAPFAAVSELAEGTVLAPGASLLESVVYTPTAEGTHDDVWILNSTGDSGQQQVAFHGAGLASGISTVSGPNWQLNGSSTSTATQITLNQANVAGSAGTAFWKTPLPSTALDVSFDATLGGGSGADGLALVLADASTQTPTALGLGGGGLGFSGIAGTALAVDTEKNGQDLSALHRFQNGPRWMPDAIQLVESSDSNRGSSRRHCCHAPCPSLHCKPQCDPQPGTRRARRVEVLRQLVLLPGSVYVGFSGGTGALADLHAIPNVSIVSQSLPTVSGALSVLGFENSKEWGVSSGTVTTSNQTTQGAASLGVSSFYYTELTSIPLSSFQRRPHRRVRFPGGIGTRLWHCAAHSRCAFDRLKHEVHRSSRPRRLRCEYLPHRLVCRPARCRNGTARSVQ